MTIYTALRDGGYLTRDAETLEEFVASVDEFCSDWPFTYDAWCEGPELDADTYLRARDEAIAVGRVMTTHRGKHHASRAHQVGPFPSGATLKTSGDKIVGRVEAGDYEVAWEKLFRPTSTPIAPAIAPEPIRPPLDWNTTTPHDTFADFIVTKGAEPTSPLYESPTTDSAYPAIAGLLRG